MEIKRDKMERERERERDEIRKLQESLSSAEGVDLGW